MGRQLDGRKSGQWNSIGVAPGRNGELEETYAYRYETSLEQTCLSQRTQSVTGNFKQGGLCPQYPVNATFRKVGE